MTNEEHLQRCREYDTHRHANEQSAREHELRLRLEQAMASRTLPDTASYSGGSAVTSLYRDGEGHLRDCRTHALVRPRP